MSIQVYADGFPLTNSLKETCESEIRGKLNPVVMNTLKAKWTLSLERGEHIAHLSWTAGSFTGDVTVKANDMYESIRRCAKKALEQLKKSHSKKQNHAKVKLGSLTSSTEND